MIRTLILRSRILWPHSRQYRRQWCLMMLMLGDRHTLKQGSGKLFRGTP